MEFFNNFTLSVIAAAAVGLWTSFAYALSQSKISAALTLIGASGSALFLLPAQAHSQIVALFCGGIFLNLALLLARKSEIDISAVFGASLLAGLSLSISKTTAVYGLMAFSFFVTLSPSQRRIILLPKLREAKRLRGLERKLGKLIVTALVLNSVLFFPAFFSSDRFFGINAEVTLKLSIELFAALWLLLRWKLAVVQFPGKLVAAFIGFMIGISPARHFQWTGLVRWDDLAVYYAAYHQYEPFILSGLAVSTILIGLGFFAQSGSQRKILKTCVLASVPAFGSGILIRSAYPSAAQDLFPALFPLCLCVALAVTSFRPVATRKDLFYSN